MAPKIIDLARELSRDHNALKQTSLSRTTLAYKLKYGLAKTIKEEIVSNLKLNSFSLNIDESTNSANESILAILVPYFSKERGMVVIQHLQSVKLESNSSSSIYNAVVNVIENYEIPWRNLVSILMDSCNVMRGKKSGFEKRIRDNKAPHLLDIDGDTCRIANNCAKKFTSEFGHHLENLFDDIYYDLKSSSKREVFFKVCSILDIKQLKPLRRPEHRWIYILNVLERIKVLWDALLVFYFFYMNKNDKELYKDDIKDVYKRNNVTSEKRQHVKSLYSVMQNQNLTKEATARKNRIINGLFIQQIKTQLHMCLFASILPEFNKYIKLLEVKKPMLHLLHVNMYHLLKEFLSFFLKPEILSDVSAKTICSLNVADIKYQLPDKLLYVAADANNVIHQNKNHTFKEFYESLRKGYSIAGTYMLKKLPLNNPVLINFTGLDPKLRRKSTTLSALLNLSKNLSHLLNGEELRRIDREIRVYQTDDCITENMSNDAVDCYWAQVFSLKSNDSAKYPALEKLVIACLSCFHGPFVEQAFNFMGEIMPDGRSSLNIDSLDAVQTVKYNLLSTSSTSCNKYGTSDPLHESLDNKLIKNMLNSWDNYKKTLDASKVEAATSLENAYEVSKTSKIDRKEISAIHTFHHQKDETQNAVPVIQQNSSMSTNKSPKTKIQQNMKHCNQNDERQNEVIQELSSTSMNKKEAEEETAGLVNRNELKRKKDMDSERSKNNCV